MELHFSEVIERPVSDVFGFYADDHLTNHPRWDRTMELVQVSEGPVEVGTVFNRRHTHFGGPVEGSMRVIQFDRDQVFALAIDDGFGEFYVYLRFEPEGPTATKVSSVADMPHMDESADTSRLVEISDRWLKNSKRLLENTD